LGRAEPDDPPRHARVATHGLRAAPATGPHQPSDLCIKVERDGLPAAAASRLTVHHRGAKKQKQEMAAGRADGRNTPLGAKASRSRIRVWGPFGETHLGQRSSAATKARHMTALVLGARSGQSPCAPGAVHTCTTVPAAPPCNTLTCPVYQRLTAVAAGADEDSRTMS
jgi:hypothetical protein